MFRSSFQGGSAKNRCSLNTGKSSIISSRTPFSLGAAVLQPSAPPQRRSIRGTRFRTLSPFGLPRSEAGAYFSSVELAQIAHGPDSLPSFSTMNPVTPFSTTSGTDPER
jgi:hypothetical protein